MNYTIREDDETDVGMVQVPVAQPAYGGGSLGNGGGGNGQNTPSCVILQLYQPVTKKTARWSIDRYGCVPEIPDPSAVDLDKYTLSEQVISPVGIEIAPDGYTPVYRITGTYTYLANAATAPGDTIPFAIPPWVDATPNELTQVQEEDYVEGITMNEPV